MNQPQKSAQLCEPMNVAAEVVTWGALGGLAMASETLSPSGQSEVCAATQRKANGIELSIAATFDQEIPASVKQCREKHQTRNEC